MLNLPDLTADDPVVPGYHIHPELGLGPGHVNHGPDTPDIGPYHITHEDALNG